MSIEVSEVRSKKELREFINLPWTIYQSDDNWVPPLKFMIKQTLDTQKHPFWKFSQQKLFTAKRNGKTVGRIAGIIDNNSNEFHSERMCGWGFFECRNDSEAAGALFAAVEQWAEKNGMKFLRGPLNPSTNYDVGMLVNGFEFPPSIMMPYNPDYYPALVESCGFAKEMDLYALRIKRGQKPTPRLQRLVKRIRRNPDISIRPVNKKDFLNEIKIVQDIYNSAWSKNWGFVPMTDEEMTHLAKEMLHIMDERLIFFIYYKQEPVGVCIMLPNYNHLLKAFNGKISVAGLIKIINYKKYIDSARILAMGIKKSHQHLGVPLVAFDYLLGLWEHDSVYKEIEVGWNLEDNYDIIKYEEEVGCRIYKTYRIYRKDVNVVT